MCRLPSKDDRKKARKETFGDSYRRQGIDIGGSDEVIEENWAYWAGQKAHLVFSLK